MLAYYLRSRDVGNDFGKLCDLLVSDRLKACVPNGPLNYVLSLEGNDWFSSDKVASLSDIYVNNHKPTVSATQYSPTRVSTAADNVNSSQGQRMWYTSLSSGRGRGIDIVKRCYRCRSTTHLARACPHSRGRGITTTTRGQPGRAHVSLCSAMNRAYVSDIGIQCCDGDVESSAEWIFGERPAVDAVSTTKSSGNVKISPLKFVNVTVAGIDCKALCDSDAQIPVGICLTCVTVM